METKHQLKHGPMAPLAPGGMGKFGVCCRHLLGLLLRLGLPELVYKSGLRSRASGPIRHIVVTYTVPERQNRRKCEHLFIQDGGLFMDINGSAAVLGWFCGSRHDNKQHYQDH